ncbi:Uncharacterised protein [Bordetella pertussis]|nr:Uncharacterised protein [Bordetella pertussis]
MVDDAAQAAVFAAELRRAFVADPVGGRAGVQGFGHHQPVRLVQAQLLLVLQRAERGDGLEMVMQRRHAHVDGRGQVFHAQRLRVVPAQPVDGARDLQRRALGARDVAQPPAHRTGQQAVVDFALDQRGQHRDVGRRVEQARQAQHGVEQGLGQARERQAAAQRLAGRRGAQLADQAGDAVRIQVERKAQVGRARGGQRDARGHRQVERGQQVVRGVVFVDVVAQLHALGALRQQRQRRPVEADVQFGRAGRTVEVQARQGGRGAAVGRRMPFDQAGQFVVARRRAGGWGVGQGAHRWGAGWTGMPIA